MSPFRQIIHGRQVQLFRTATAKAPLLYTCLYQDDSQALLKTCQKLHTPPFHFVSLTNLSWDEDLSPWPEGQILSREDHFSGQAKPLLNSLLAEIRPWALSHLPASPAYEAIAGYSLAGLFSLYAAYQTPIFSRVASASGSLWYPGFAAYAKEQAFLQPPTAIYLSLGDRESHTRNSYFRTNEAISRDLCHFYQHQGIVSTFVLNKGNHFQDNVLRLAKGIHWLFTH